MLAHTKLVLFSRSTSISASFPVASRESIHKGIDEGSSSQWYRWVYILLYGAVFHPLAVVNAQSEWVHHSHVMTVFSCPLYLKYTGAPDIFCVYSGLGQGDLALVLG